MPTNLMYDQPVEAVPPHWSSRQLWRDRAPFLLYALTGFTGLLAEQGFEKYVAGRVRRLVCPRGVFS
jgi:hypothetical protein